jgi:hypothetical protein
MRTPNAENPCCPRCAKTLKGNGTTLKGKPRFRCSDCGYSETQNSIAHNRNTRSKFDPLMIESSMKQRARSYRHNHTTKAENCSICSLTENLEGHEFDYTRPLDTFTFCRNCHRKLHQILKQLEQQNPLVTYLLFKFQSVNHGKRLEPNLCYTLAKCEGLSYL